MYKVASDGRQRVLHRGRLADWLNGEEAQSLQEQLRNLQTADRNICERIKLLPPKSEERNKLGLQRQEICRQIQQMRPLVFAQNLGRRAIAEIFVEICKEQLPPGPFKALWAAAKKKQQQDHERAQRALDEIAKSGEVAA